jgi:hypothetical protein
MKNKMKTTIILTATACALALGATSCMKIDNFDTPESRLYGNVLDAETGKPILSDQGHTRIRIWERSFRNATHQEIPVKQDGTYNNNRLFPGHYDMLPLGAWWPVDTVKNVPLGKSATQDFKVTPYLRVIDFTAKIGEAGHPTIKGPYITVSCRLQAPVEEGLPLIQDCRAYLSLNQFCGADHNIGTYNVNAYRMIKSPTNWSAVPKDADGASTPYTMDIPVKAGYTYFVRAGATVKDDTQGNKYNYSEIVKVTIPN